VDDGLPAEFDRDFVDLVRRVMVDAYVGARDHYDPDRGIDGQIFGFVVYKMAAHIFESEIPLLSGARVEWNGRGREIRRGDKHVRWNKVGHSEQDEIGSSFPSRSKSAAIAAERNLKQLDLGFGDEQPVHWIIAHAGNPLDGLRSLYLAAPIETRNDRVVGWLRWHALYDGNHPDDVNPILPEPGPIQPEPEELGDFDLRIREDDDEVARG
jgi:hypothetical protein